MRIKIQMKNGSAGYTAKTEENIIEQVVELMNNPDVISVTLTKQSPRECVKSVTGKEKSYGNH